MEQLKENAALSGSRSCGVAPWQEKMNREAANGSSVLQMAAVDKLEETIMDFLRRVQNERLCSAAARAAHESGMGVTTVLKTSSCLLRSGTRRSKRTRGGKDLRSPACLEVHMV